jgi:hypothetical protein
MKTHMLAAIAVCLAHAPVIPLRAQVPPESATPKEVIEYLMSITEIWIEDPEIARLYKRVESAPDTYAAVLDAMLSIPADLNSDAEASRLEQMQGAVGVLPLLGSKAAAPLLTRCYVEATQLAHRLRSRLDAQMNAYRVVPSDTTHQKIMVLHRCYERTNYLRINVLDKAGVLRSENLLIPALADFVTDPDFKVRLNIIHYFEAVRAVDALLSAMRMEADPHSDCWKLALQALRKMSLSELQERELGMLLATHGQSEKLPTPREPGARK